MRQPPIEFASEAERLAQFPVARESVFLAHAGVAALPACVSDAICAYTRESSRRPQEFAEVLRDIKNARALSARFIGAQPDEIALLGPTSLGLSLFANGLPWNEGDEVLCYHGDYPANVYPWMDLARRGVRVRFLEPEEPGKITPDLIERSLTPRTRLAALASCHFFTGARIDVDAIGALLKERGVLFSLDAIQTLGAFGIDVERAHVDFLSADAHKWMLGPVAIGIVYVARRNFELLRPTLLGAWNVISPNYNAGDEIKFVPTAQRYEPGVLNIGGIYGMAAAIELFERHGIENISRQLLYLKEQMVEQLEPLGFEIIGCKSGDAASAITTFRHPKASCAMLFAALEKAGVTASLRHDREGREHLRFSPHFYNTADEISQAIDVLRTAL